MAKQLDDRLCIMIVRYRDPSDNTLRRKLIAEGSTSDPLAANARDKESVPCRWEAAFDGTITVAQLVTNAIAGLKAHWNVP